MLEKRNENDFLKILKSKNKTKFKYRKSKLFQNIKEIKILKASKKQDDWLAFILS